MEGQQEHPPAIDASTLYGEPPRSAESSQSAAPWGSPTAADEAAEPDAFAQRPEIYVGAAFAGGLVLAGALRLLGR
jgi:hypothetical protein